LHDAGKKVMLDIRQRLVLWKRVNPHIFDGRIKKCPGTGPLQED
jgi:hypothetical protein